MRTLPLIAALALIGAGSTSALAQDTTMPEAEMTTAPVEDDDDFPWGLLGLLGLAGLLGRKRDDRRTDDVRRT